MSRLIFLLLICTGCDTGTEKKSVPVEYTSEPIFTDSIGLIEAENERLLSFLEDPLDLQTFKTVKGSSLSSVTNAASYQYTPKYDDYVYYCYSAFPNGTNPATYSPIEVTVLKSGERKHTWDDANEILIGFTVIGKDDDLKEANLYGLRKAEVESRFGVDYRVLEDVLVYSNENNVLMIQLEDSEVKKFSYARLNTGIIDEALLRQMRHDLEQVRRVP
ncbi:hypothetical protein AB9P05_10520 [Roseivirga sp. BDSF3-8]|uniref:hypothetical protein n=1 Tax=Roseivirga sp. BDSF3-8 TaxID=3241598 RepID=UPI0035320A3B